MTGTLIITNMTGQFGITLQKAFILSAVMYSKLIMQHKESMQSFGRMTLEKKEFSIVIDG